MDNLWNRRTNSGKLSLSTSGSGAGTGQPDSASARNASFTKRFGGDTSAHGGKSNPFNSATTPGGSLASPGASSAFGLGSGAFASFGSAKTPKSPGNPFDFAPKSAVDKAPAVPRLPAGLSGAAPVGAEGGAAGRDGKARHALRDEWVFWFRPPISKANGYIEYEKTLHPVCTVATVEDFFSVYAHLKRPSALPLVSDYHLFKKGVRPIWEDDENKKGGKWIVRLRKGVADRYWEDLLLAIVGDQFAEAREDLCGAVLSVRNGEDILSVWAKEEGRRVLKIRDTLKSILAFPPDTKLEWKSHDSSIQQRTAIEESRRDKTGNRKSQQRDHTQPSYSAGGGGGAEDAKHGSGIPGPS